MKMTVMIAHFLLVVSHITDAVAAQPPAERIARALIAAAATLLLWVNFLEHHRTPPSEPERLIEKDADRSE